MNESLDDSTNADISRKNRVRLAVGLVAAAATPMIATVAGFDDFVLARLATNHNEVAATDV